MHIDAFAMNEEAELTGVWKELGDGAAILVARSGNTKYDNMLEAELAPYRTALGATSLSPEESREIIIKVTASTILLGWRGLIDSDGNEPSYSVDKAVEWLKAYKEFYKIVVTVASNLNNYREAVIKEVQEDIKK